MSDTDTDTESPAVTADDLHREALRIDADGATATLAATTELDYNRWFDRALGLFAKRYPDMPGHYIKAKDERFDLGDNYLSAGLGAMHPVLPDLAATWLHIRGLAEAGERIGPPGPLLLGGDVTLLLPTGDTTAPLPSSGAPTVPSFEAVGDDWPEAGEQDG